MNQALALQDKPAVASPATPVLAPYQMTMAEHQPLLPDLNAQQCHGSVAPFASLELLGHHPSMALESNTQFWTPAAGTLCWVPKFADVFTGHHSLIALQTNSWSLTPAVGSLHLDLHTGHPESSGSTLPVSVLASNFGIPP